MSLHWDGMVQGLTPKRHTFLHFSLVVIQMYGCVLGGTCRGHFQMCQNNKNFSLKICFFPIEQMPPVIKMFPVLEASNINAEIGALRVSSAPLDRCHRRLSGKQHVLLGMKIKDQVQSAFPLQQRDIISHST